MSYWHTASWLLDAMQTLRELKIAYQYLNSRSFVTKDRHRLSWPVSLVNTEILSRQQSISDACAGWFEIDRDGI